MNQAIAVILILILMWSPKQFSWLEELGGPLTPSTMTVGFILLISYMAGKVVYRLKIPKITGYMLVGIIVGPYVFDLISHEMTHQLQLINGLALSLIALTAGAELKLRGLRLIWKSLCAITFLHILMLWIVFVVFVCVARAWFPFLSGESWSTVLVVGMILGTIAAASSPAVTIAVINECQSRGPVTESTLGVTVLKDILVIVFFSAVLAVGRGVVMPDVVMDLKFVSFVGVSLLSSVGVGVLLGILILLYLKFVNTENTLFIIGVCFLSAEVGIVFHLEPAIISLSAGFFMENVYPERGERLVEAIERGSLPVYALFFCLAGAIINIEVLKEIWILALVLVGLRLIVLKGATYWGARIGGAAGEVGRFGWLGYISQAGVSLGLGAMVLRVFPEWGAPLQTLIISIIAFNQLLGPIGFRYALIKSKEATA